MPIQQIDARPRAPLMGKIRLGVKEEKTNRDGKLVEYPTSVEHFVLKDAPDVERVYGPDPKEIDIMFPADDLEVVLPTYLEWWTSGRKGPDGKVIAGTLMCKGNGPGENNEPGVAQHFCKKDPVTGVVPSRACLGSACPDWVDDKGYSKCKPTMRVTVLLPLVSPYGVYRIDTTSWNSIKSFHDQIRWIRELNNGRIRMIPLKIVREAMEVKHVDKKTGKEMRKIFHIMKLKPNQMFLETHGEKVKQIMGVFNAGTQYLLPSAQEVQSSPMEDNYGVVDLESQQASETKLATSESVAADPEINAMFDRLQSLTGMQFSAKARLIAIRKKEGEADIKAAVVATLNEKLAEAEKRAATETTTQQPAVQEPVAPAPVVQQPAVPVQPDENGIL